MSRASKIEESGSSNEDEPLVVYRTGNKRGRAPRKKSKKQFRRSGSESSDFEKYTYFDENKSKRKIKLDPNMAASETKRLIEEIRVENSRLIEERDRIDEIKLKERLEMRAEIARLKALMIELKIDGVLRNRSVPGVGNTANLIAAMKRIVDDPDFGRSVDDDERSVEKVKSLRPTGADFWKKLGRIEANAVPVSISTNRPLESGKIQETESVTMQDQTSNLEAETKEDVVTNVAEDDSVDIESDFDNTPEPEPERNATEDVCSECGFDSSWSSFVARHREAFRNGVKLAPCNTCNLKFLQSGHFDGKHQLKRPSGKIVENRSKFYICDTCGLKCATRSGLSQHLSRHEEAKYPCPHCSYRSRRKAYLKKHVETHSKTSPKHRLLG